ncbi:MAG: glutamate racemase [Bdellovibrionota bacterium]
MASLNQGPMVSAKGHDNRPIGVFDSGIGGITVLRALVKDFPKESFIYLGDTARLPYGSKSPETVKKYLLQNIKFLISKNVKAIVVACNTASTQIDKISPEVSFDGVKIYNVIDPGAALACKVTENKKIAVLATRATISSESYAKKIKKILPEAEVLSQACPLFVPLAEEGWYEDPVTNLIAFRYLNHLKNSGVDTVVLGCTHYPLLKTAIKKIFGNYVHLVDSGEAISQLLADDFKNGVLNPSEIPQSSLTIALTDASLQFETLSNELLCSVMSKQIHFETVSVI